MVLLQEMPNQCILVSWCLQLRNVVHYAVARLGHFNPGQERKLQTRCHTSAVSVTSADQSSFLPSKLNKSLLPISETTCNVWNYVIIFCLSSNMTPNYGVANDPSRLLVQPVQPSALTTAEDEDAKFRAAHTLARPLHQVPDSGDKSPPFEGDLPSGHV